MFYSVIIPLFNKASYVAKAIESVFEQTFTDYELIIVDDGSNDGSAEIALKSIESRANCRLLRQDNAGVSVARNNGVAASTGDYLCFLDADDWWNPSFLEEMSKLITDYPDAGIYGTGYFIVNETKHKTRVAQIGVEDGFEKGCINYCQTYARTMYMPLWTGAVCIPRIVFDETGGFPKGIKLGEDFILWVHIALKHKVVLLNHPLSYYNQDVDSLTRGVGRLHQPQEHMLWNLTDMEQIEKTDTDYKQLIDNLRVYELLPYFLTKAYRSFALAELEKVDWSRQPASARKQYTQPWAWLKIKDRIMTIGSKLKQILRK